MDIFIIICIGSIIGGVYLYKSQKKIEDNFKAIYPNKQYAEGTLYYIVDDNGAVLVPKLSIKNKESHIKLNINDIKIYEDGIEKSTTGKAVAGAIAFGTVGAIIGSNMKGKKIVKTMGINIYTDIKSYYVNFVGNGCKRDSWEFKSALDNMERAYNILIKYVKNNEKDESTDIPDKIKKLSELQKQDIISMEEFQEKKKELLEKM
ncbi:hypothetical protein A0J52_09990 [Clostridium sporogenes]|uniref:SHOCT domain-containing protein n=1 Tax=Clostridium sporogenes TaxID=1509 RepID=UPI00078004A3|nr:SHOCT domain-containing protein [Clostridium sporogenes]KYN77182.1 hypothetical protein A0J52_09990 [Clostridium sporogenes]